MRILITGAPGMLGHSLLRLAAAEAPSLSVLAGVRTPAQESLIRSMGFVPVHCDITDMSGVRRILGMGVDVVINAAGITKVLASDASAAMCVNAEAPHCLAAECDARGVRLIHISTDCVFSGSAGGYTETDTPDPVDLYGRSKLDGEVTTGPHLTIRTSFVGREIASAHGLLEWFLAQRGQVKGYRRVFWSGLTTLALCRILLSLAARPDVTGLLNISGERLDKYSVLQLFAEAYRRTDVTIHPVDEPAFDRSLDGSRCRSLGIAVPSLRSMIFEFAASPLGAGRVAVA